MNIKPVHLEKDFKFMYKCSWSADGSFTERHLIQYTYLYSVHVPVPVAK